MGGQKAVMFSSINQVELIHRDIPVPGVGEVCIAMELLGVCGAESRAIRGGKKGVNATRITPGIVLGHEGVGTVHSVGIDVVGFSVGDRVAVLSHIPCYVCENCLIGVTNRCLHLEHVGLTRDGSAACFVVLPARVPTIKKISHKLPVNLAALIEPISCVLHGIQKVSSNAISVFQGEYLLVLGAGPIGMFWVLFALLHNVNRVFIVDPRKKSEVIFAAIDKRFWSRVSVFSDISQVPFETITTTILATSFPDAGTVLLPYLASEAKIVCFSGLNGYAPELLPDGSHGFYLTREEKETLNPKLFSEVHYRETKEMLLFSEKRIYLIGSSGYTDSDVSYLLELFEMHPDWHGFFTRLVTKEVGLEDAVRIYQHFGGSADLSSHAYHSEETIKILIRPE